MKYSEIKPKCKCTQVSSSKEKIYSEGIKIPCPVKYKPMCLDG